MLLLKNSSLDLLGRYKFKWHWCGLIDAIPKQWCYMIHNEGILKPNNIDVGLTLSDDATLAPLARLRFRDVYSLFIDDIKKEPVSQSSLRGLYNLTVSVVIFLFCHSKLRLTKKLRWFQYRIIHNILPINILLFKINLKEVDIYTLPIVKLLIYFDKQLGNILMQFLTLHLLSNYMVLLIQIWMTLG